MRDRGSQPINFKFSIEKMSKFCFEKDFFVNFTFCVFGKRGKTAVVGICWF